MMNNIAKVVVDNIPFPLWIKNLNRELIFGNKKFEEVYKENLKEGININDCICKKCLIKDTCDKGIEQVINENKSTDFEVEISSNIYRCYINPYIDSENNIIGTIGILIDITETKKNQKKLEEREDILKTIIDTIPDYIFYKDKDSRYIGYNKKWQEYYQKFGINSMIGKNDFESGAISKVQAENFIKQDQQVMLTKETIVDENKIKCSDGTEIIEEIKKVPVISEDGEVWGIVGIASDVTEKIEIREKLKKLSYTDILTKVYNRAYFEEIQDEINKQENLPIGVIMGDVNGLKIVNDTFGHLEGDRYLKSITNILKASTSNNDLIFRWGGDEFVILIPNCDEKRCEEVIFKIVEECKTHKFDLIEMSIALGSSIKSCIEQDIYTNLQEAEETLYRQKFLKERSIRGSIIHSLNQSLQEKNVETEYHTRRLVKYATKIGERLDFTTAKLDELKLSTKLHDIGKIGINEEILLKPDKLTSDEFKEIETHTERGYRILHASRELSHIAKNVLAHHERYDGKVYPLGLKGDEIPIIARIINIVDSYDAMITDRGYNIVKTKEEAIKEIQMCKGSQFDPEIADIFIDILKNEE